MSPLLNSIKELALALLMRERGLHELYRTDMAMLQARPLRWPLRARMRPPSLFMCLQRSPSISCGAGRAAPRQCCTLTAGSFAGGRAPELMSLLQGARACA